MPDVVSAFLLDNHDFLKKTNFFAEGVLEQFILVFSGISDAKERQIFI